MIYADAECRPSGRYGNTQASGPAVAGTYAEFAAHWSYTRADPAFRRLLADTTLYAVWDDHEVINDFSPDRAARAGRDLFEPGRRAMLDYNPIDRGEGRLYGRFRIGRHMDLFLLDTRSYRDDKALADGQGKTLLGHGQRDWLTASVTGSDATWKVIVTSVPLSIPTGTPEGEGRDGWADGGGPTGYEDELYRILGSFASAGARNLVWLTADVHFATVLRHAPFPEDPDFVMIEAAAGPLSAGLFPRRVLDPSLRPQRLFFHGPDVPDRELGFADALEWMNFGLLDVDEQGGLTLRYLNGAGREIFRMELPSGG
jgi:alkaline phosphatase D